MFKKLLSLFVSFSQPTLYESCNYKFAGKYLIVLDNDNNVIYSEKA